MKAPGPAVSKAFEVLLYFSSAVDEELTPTDIEARWGLRRDSTTAYLAASVKNGMLEKADTPDGVVYRCGPRLRSMVAKRIQMPDRLAYARVIFSVRQALRSKQVGLQDLAAELALDVATVRCWLVDLHQLGYVKPAGREPQQWAWCGE
jgi:DNA-binding IclR family transcriptional regulator